MMGQGAGPGGSCGSDFPFLWMLLDFNFVMSRSKRIRTMKSKIIELVEIILFALDGLGEDRLQGI